MTIRVKMTLNIGMGSGHKQEEEIEVADDWYDLTADEQDDYLQSYWQEWAGNYIDGGIRELDAN